MLSAMIGVLLAVGVQEPQANKVLPAAAQLQALQQEMESASSDHSEARERAKTEEEREKISTRYRERAEALADRALELARMHPNDPTAFDALVWIIDELRWGAGRAMTALARDFLESERLVKACRSTFGAPPGDFEETETLLRAANAKSPHRKVRGFACFYLAEHLKKRAVDVRHLEQHPDEVGRYARDYWLDDSKLKRFRARGAADLEGEAEALYKQTIASYGELETLREATLADLAAGELFDLRQLSVGKEAPEIMGRDVEGRQFKLSDYRGRVVVLTFSGNWCGPCLRMYPHEREIVERLREKPFALLSVTNDKEPATLRQAIERGEITWRCWWDGGMDGPICLEWGVNQWSSIFVLDSRGIIRFRNVRDEILDKAVETLLKELNVARDSQK